MHITIEDQPNTQAGDQKEYSFLRIPGVVIEPFKQMMSTIGSDIILSLSGYIDEKAKFREVEDEDCDRLIIDFKEVEYINSTGIQHWGRWIELLDKVFIKKQILLRQVPKVIMDQINGVKDFIPLRCRFESFYVPFYCVKCNKTQNVLFEMKTHAQVTDGKVSWQIPTVECHGPCELDVLPNQYFRAIEEREKAPAHFL